MILTFASNNIIYSLKRIKNEKDIFIDRRSAIDR